MIAWVDVETTGLDPKGGSLLEVGIILTDDDLREVDRTSVFIVPPPGLRLVLPPQVAEMHKASGLLADCYGMDAEPREVAMFKLCRWLNDRAKEPVMAGSTVGFDRAWLKAKMPVLAALFHYRSIDVSSLKELNKRWEFAEPWAGDRNLHRALPDLEDSIAELRHYREAIFT